MYLKVAHLNVVERIFRIPFWLPLKKFRKPAEGLNLFPFERTFGCLSSRPSALCLCNSFFLACAQLFLVILACVLCQFTLVDLNSELWHEQLLTKQTNKKTNRFEGRRKKFIGTVDA